MTAASTGQARPNRRREIQLSDEERAAFLRENRKAALCTIDKDGFPHVVAMTYAERDGAYYMTSYAKAQKVLNIRRNPKVGLMIEAGGSYAELRGVMVRGECEIIEERDAVLAAFALISGRAPSEEASARCRSSRTTSRGSGDRMARPRASFCHWPPDRLWPPVYGPPT